MGDTPAFEQKNIEILTGITKLRFRRRPIPPSSHQGSRSFQMPVFSVRPGARFLNLQTWRVAGFLLGLYPPQRLSHPATAT